MLTKTQAIVLHSIKYGETRLIVDMFTKEYGRLSFIVSLPKSPKSKIKKQYFQPLAMLEIETDVRPRLQLQKLSDVRLLHPFSTIPFSQHKLSISLFVAEFLYYALRGEQQNALLFDYIVNSLQWLDGQDGRFANFHLVFLMRLSRFLGFYPNLDDYTVGDYFDLRESVFLPAPPIHHDFLQPQEAEKYIQKAIAANSLTENLTRRAVLYGTASELYRSMSETDRALEYARKALDTERMVGDSARIGVRLSQLASAQLSSSKIDDARRSLEEAIPLLLRSGNLHSWGICQNQMGDILVSEDKNNEATACYLDAAMLFLKQGDKYNELHAREGLYKTMKDVSPSDAMMHLERAKLLQDSIYQQETGEALGKYNAIYYNDILEQEKNRTERRDRIVLLSVIFAAIVFIALITAVSSITYRRHRKKIMDYEQNISSMQEMYDELRLKYQNVDAFTLQESVKLTTDDKKFLSQLASVIYALSEKGVTDIDSIASQLHISFATLRRRLQQTLSVTPSAYIQRMRMQKAKDLLQGYRDMPITEVAEKCGYTQVQNFTRAFTRFYGTTPSDERKN